jgi:hypothetical protein
MCEHVEPTTWAAIRERLPGKPLGEIQDALDESVAEGLDTDLFVASYSYGELLVEGGRLRPPNKHCRECQALMDVFDGDIPLALVLDKSVEVFAPSDWDSKNPRHTPLRLIGKGELFGVFETLDLILGTSPERPPWEVSAGARSIWVLAPLGNSEMIKAFFSKLGHPRPAWRDEEPAWKLAQAVSHRKKEGWYAKVVIFPRRVIDFLAKRRDGALFRLIMETGWRQSSVLRHTALQDANLHALIGGEFHQFTTVRHWLNIVNGAAPAFCPYWQCPEPAGPFGQLESELAAVLDEWKFPYHPVILQPVLLDSSVPVGYYSVRCPSLPGNAALLSERTLSGVIDRLEDILGKNLERELGRRALFPDGAVRCFTRFRTEAQSVNGSRGVPGMSDDGGSRMGLRGLDEPHLDFLRSDSARKVYWGSPFFVAGARLCRSDTRISTSRANR